MNRTVDVHLWYPADTQRFSRAPKTRYSSALYGRPLNPAKWDPLSWSVEAEIAREDVPIDPNGQSFPVLVFSHGNANDPFDYAYTLEQIAGEGFVVAAPSHTGNTQDDVRVDYINGLTSWLELLNPCSLATTAPEPLQAAAAAALGLAQDRRPKIDAGPNEGCHGGPGFSSRSSWLARRSG